MVHECTLLALLACQTMLIDAELEKKKIFQVVQVKWNLQDSRFIIEDDTPFDCMRFDVEFGRAFRYNPRHFDDTFRNHPGFGAHNLIITYMDRVEETKPLAHRAHGYEKEQQRDSPDPILLGPAPWACAPAASVMYGNVANSARQSHDSCSFKGFISRR